MRYAESEPFLQRVAEGREYGYWSKRLSGQCSNITTNTIPMDVWGYNRPYNFSNSAANLYISSTSESDSLDISIVGLDGDYAEKTITQALSGQAKTRVGSESDLFIRSNEIYNANGSALIGTVYLYEDCTVNAGVPSDPTKVKGVISIGSGKSKTGVYTAPYNKTGYLKHLYAAMVGLGTGPLSATPEHVTLYLMRRCYGCAAIEAGSVTLINTGGSILNRPYILPIPIPPKADLWAKVMTTNSTSGNVSVSVSCDILEKLT